MKNPPMASLPSGFVPFFMILLLTGFVLSCSDDDSEQPAPQVTGITPDSGLPNAWVSISGSFFSTVLAENHVTFNGKEALVTNASPTQLTVVVPVDAESGPVAITVKSKPAATQPVFTVELIQSVVAGMSPLTGGYNTVVIITGSNFYPEAASNAVTFNGVPAVVESATTTSLTVRVPARSGTGQVLVNGVPASTAFTYVSEVFLVGYEYSLTGKTVAKFWKNGIATSLSTGDQNAAALDIAVDGDDVYVSGYKANGPGVVPMYWKNAAAIPLADGDPYAYAEAIAVMGNDVYVAGYESGAVRNVATYWKNRVPVFITDESASAFVTALVLKENDVYTAGRQFHSSGKLIAIYWKNNTAFPLTDGTSNAVANDIFVAGNDVYVAGYEENPGKSPSAKYWKNGTPVFLTDGTTFANAQAILVDGNDVYVAGYEINTAGKTVAKYWKNGIPVLLSNGATVAYAHDIAMLGNDVYVSGSELNLKGRSVAKYWKNGTPTIITDGGYDANAVAIVVR